MRYFLTLAFVLALGLTAHADSNRLDKILHLERFITTISPSCDIEGNEGTVKCRDSDGDVVASMIFYIHLERGAQFEQSTVKAISKSKSRKAKTVNAMKARLRNEAKEQGDTLRDVYANVFQGLNGAWVVFGVGKINGDIGEHQQDDATLNNTVGAQRNVESPFSQRIRCERRHDATGDDRDQQKDDIDSRS